MAVAKRQITSGVFIYLLVSFSPLDAARLKDLRNTYEAIHEVKGDLANLEKDLATEFEGMTAANGQREWGSDTNGFASKNRSEGNLCGEKALRMSVTVNGVKEVQRFGTWQHIVLLEKECAGGCVKTYVGQCAKGGIEVTKRCPDGSTTTSIRSFGMLNSRKTDIKDGETVQITLGGQERQLTTGVVKFKAVEPASAEEQCALYKHGFESKLSSISKEFGSWPNLNSKLDVVAASHMLLNMRSATKRMQVAERAQCEWVRGKNFQGEALREIVQATSGSNPCFEKARDMLQLAVGQTPEKQAETFQKAMRTLASDTCDGDVITQASMKHKLAISIQDIMHQHDALDAEVDANADIVAEVLSDQSQEDVLRSRASTSLPDGNETPSKDLRHAANASMMQTTEGIHAIAHSLSNASLGWIVAAILSALGFIAMLFLLVLVCFALIALTMVLLGLILCSLKSILVAVVNIFKHKDSKWRNDWKGCMDYWLSKTATSGASDSMDIALCTASLMQNQR